MDNCGPSILFGNKNYQTLVTSYNSNNSQRNYVKWKEPSSIGHKVYDTIYITFQITKL